MDSAPPVVDMPQLPWHAEFVGALRMQLQNQIVGGSVALFIASALLRLFWQAVAAMREAVQDALFTRYDFPVGSPQVLAAARFLQTQPAMAKASRRVVMDRRASRFNAAISARAQAQAGQAPAPVDMFEVPAEGHGEEGASRFVSVPTLAAGRSTMLLWRGRLIWARAGAGQRVQGVTDCVGNQEWSPFSAMQSFDAMDTTFNAATAATNAAAGGASPEGSISLLVLRKPFGRDRRGEAAVASLLEEGERLATRHAGGVRFTSVFVSRSNNAGAAMQSGVSAQFYWVTAGARPSRSIDSVILPHNAAAQLLADARAFVDSEAWYAQRGVPYRRGYLLHGTPGSGKTSLITAIAGELQLPVYCLSLSAQGLDDAALQMLLSQVNAATRVILVLEDVDTAFTPVHATAGAGGEAQMGGRLSFSGLLNALDGLVATEGRLLFMTANDPSRVPPALVRNGRVDEWMCFGPAVPEQAERIYRRFYAAPDGTPEAAAVAAMAARFAAAVTAGRFSMAALQGHLLRFRASPEDALRSVPELLRGEGAAAVTPRAAAKPRAAATPRATGPATPTPHHGTHMTLRHRPGR